MAKQLILAGLALLACAAGVTGLRGGVTAAHSASADKPPAYKISHHGEIKRSFVGCGGKILAALGELEDEDLSVRMKRAAGRGSGF